MIVVYYCYLRKRDGKICHSNTLFYDVNKACRFIYSLQNAKNKWYESYSSDDPEESNELYQKL